MNTSNESALLTLLSNILIIKADIISLEAYSLSKIIKILIESYLKNLNKWRTWISGHGKTEKSKDIGVPWWCSG